MLSAIQIIAERRIARAIEEGSLQTEAWHGKPLPMDDDRLIPADLRMAYKILKNSGYLPPEIEARKEIRQIEELIAATEDEHVRLRQMKKLNILKIKLAGMRQRPLHLDEDYYDRVVEKVSVKAETANESDR